MSALKDCPSKELGRAMLRALNVSQYDRTTQGLTPKYIQPASIFILLTHICESAIPFTETIMEFERAITYNYESENPKDKVLTIKKKTGRIPMADKITRSILKDVAHGKVSFTDAFDEAKYVIRDKDGTSKGRTWVLQDEDGSSTGVLSDSDSDDNA